MEEKVPKGNLIPYSDQVYPIGEDEIRILNDFRRIIHSSPDIFCCPVDDSYLLKFLRFRKYNINEAINAAIKWWKLQERLLTKHPQLNPEAFRTGYIRILKQRDLKGRQVIVCNFRNWDASIIPLMDLVRAQLPILENIINRQLTQVNGAVYVADFDGMNWSHFTALKNIGQMRLISGLSDGFPMRIKKIHVINHSALFAPIWTLVKHLLKPKLRNRIQFNNSDYTPLHISIGKEFLPEEYNGQLSYDEAFEQDLKIV